MNFFFYLNTCFHRACILKFMYHIIYLWMYIFKFNEIVLQVGVIATDSFGLLGTNKNLLIFSGW